MALFTVEDPDVEAARRWCDPCPVASECAVAGIGEAGIWGGLTEAERRKLHRALRGARHLVVFEDQAH